MTGVFISYRRQDTRADAGRIHDHFVEQWGRDRVFMDIDSIPGGSDFAQHIQNTLSNHPVVVVLIGVNWVSIEKEIGRRRLDDPGDYVRMEVSLSLSQGLKVIPVLVGGARMPSAAELPEDLRPLSKLNAREVSDRHFSQDVTNLMRDVGHRRSPVIALSLAGLALALLTVGAWLWRDRSTIDSPVITKTTTPRAHNSPNTQRASIKGTVANSPPAAVKSDLVQWLMIPNPVLSPGDVLEVKLSTQSSHVRVFAIFSEGDGRKKRVEATYGKDAGGIRIAYRIPDDASTGNRSATVYIQAIRGSKEEQHTIEYELVTRQ